MMPLPRANVLGVGVHALDLEEACRRIVAAAKAGETGYVCCCDANSVSWARRDPEHRQRLNHAMLVTPDGMPVVWLARRDIHRGIDRVYGPDLLLAVCAATEDTDLQHYFYGGGQGTADRLVERLRKQFPRLPVAGVKSPPFSDFPDDVLNTAAKTLREVAARIVWVGLSTPKQERVMAGLSARLPGTILLGVGAAFDLHSGRIRQAPRWVQRSGTEWIWRLALEPRRLGPRYLRNNPLFLLRAFAQLSGVKRYPIDEASVQKSSP